MEGADKPVAIAQDAFTVPSLCPVCGGVMIELHNRVRCVRCQFQECETCEGRQEPDG